MFFFLVYFLSGHYLKKILWFQMNSSWFHTNMHSHTEKAHLTLLTIKSFNNAVVYWRNIWHKQLHCEKIYIMPNFIIIWWQSLKTTISLQYVSVLLDVLAVDKKAYIMLQIEVGNSTITTNLISTPSKLWHSSIRRKLITSIQEHQTALSIPELQSQSICFSLRPCV